MPFFAAEPELAPTDAMRARARGRKLALIVVALVVISLLSTLLFDSRASTAAPAPQVVRTSASLAQTDAQNSNLDFSKFGHTNPTHARLPCLLCHRRESNAPQPKLPGHMPCSGCHTQQFADQSSPICAICHTNPPARDLRSFPPLQSFNARFDHARHTNGAGRPATGCVACHKSERRGVGLTIPAGASAHVTCYQCHGPRAQGSAGQDNNKIKSVSHRSFGFRSAKHFIADIYHSCARLPRQLQPREARGQVKLRRLSSAARGRCTRAASQRAAAAHAPRACGRGELRRLSQRPARLRRRRLHGLHALPSRAFLALLIHQLMNAHCGRCPAQSSPMLCAKAPTGVARSINTGDLRRTIAPFA